ncbi:hypothetical protein DPSP01_007946 [Paraphaeosphaeria sporulosa]|uniref:Extracellular membrane protein CFEM domain-containing protein n=1 Tax=Paraphaeosphaeria sporulosa TaxID=1460663 RepID=A0A177CDB6_9PLEO|nr:uncharacterized protein CC84DRAFT_1216973 [Paraphaeosphaeria sporulosa]OAG05643.1 hypothetical protein CC84DRAFT_1216973 [Paraphaeosphaeria sporulosa]
MRLYTFVSVALVASRHASAIPHEDEEHDEAATTITSSASLACGTGKAMSQWNSCSASISREIDKCDANNLSCACSHANVGFDCLTSFCPSHTPDICKASLAIHGLCALANAPTPTLTGITCPSDVPDLLASFIPSGVRNLIPLALTELLPSNINNNIPTDIPFWNGPGDPVRKGTSLSLALGDVIGAGLPAATAVAKDNSGGGIETGRVGSLDRVLVVGIVVSVAVGGLSAWL